MRPNTQFPADLITFTKEILNGKLHWITITNKQWIAVTNFD